MKPLEQRFWGKIKKSAGCWLWRGATAGHMGYGHFNGADRGYLKAHRYSYEIHKGDIPSGFMVLHTCDNPLCVNPGHLFLGTGLDNMRDCKLKGRHKSSPQIGEKNPMAKLTKEQALEAYRMAGTHQGIADYFGVSRQAITRIKGKLSWGSLHDTP